MSSAIRDVVDRMYREHIDLPVEWSPEQRRLFIDRETARLSRRAAELAADLSEAAIAAWTQRAGHEPDYLTTVGLTNNATSQAIQTVLTQEVYEQIPTQTDPTEDDLPDPQNPAAPMEVAVDRSNPDRWRTAQRSEPTPAVAALAARVWPTRSDWFLIKAEYLLQTRLEDGLPLPHSPDSELAHELAQLVEEDLRADGLPL